MDFNFFTSVFSREMIHAFSWTLIHSLWQGLILAVFTGIIILSTRKSRPVLRYNLFAGLMLIFISISCFTFWYELGQQDNPKNSLVINSLATAGNLADNGTSTGQGFISISTEGKLLVISKLVKFCTENAALIVGVWFLIFLLKSVKAAAGLYYIHQIRNHKIHDVNKDWKSKLNLLANQLHIDKSILLVESEMVNVPLVAGFFKPMILVPLGLLTNLPYDQVEAILLHELAHIKRKDYLVNLFQSVAENIFFFNPAVLWVSFLIREEREHCCDDLAIAVTKNKSVFVNALVLFQEYKMNSSVHAVAFTGKRNHLLDRVKRIIYNNNKQLDAMEKLFVAASLITVTALSFAFSPTPEKKVIINKPIFEQKVEIEPLHLNYSDLSSVDTLPSKSGKGELGIQTFEITKNERSYKITRKNGEISELEIDGKRIPKDKFESYAKEIDPILEEVEEQQEQAEIQREEAEELRKEADVQRDVASKLRIEAEGMRKQTEELRVQAEQMRKSAEAMRMDAETQREKAEEFRYNSNNNKEYSKNLNKNELYAKGNEDFSKNTEDLKKQAELLKKDAEHSRNQADEMREQAEVMRKQADEMRAKAEVSRREAEKMRAEYEKLQSELIDELKKEGVIKNQDNLSYKLNGEELIVNGVKQSEQLHSRLKAKYIKNQEVEMVYNWKGRTGYTTSGMIYK